MNQLNQIILEGNLTKPAELVEPAEGFKKAYFTLAVNRWYKDKNGNGVEEVSFFDVDSFGRMAEFCEKNGSKGRGVRVIGRLKQDRWTDGDGKNRSRIYVVAEQIEYKPVKHSDNSEEPATSCSQSETDKNLEEEAMVAANNATVKEETVF